MVRGGEDTVTFRWKNRDTANRPEISTLRGVEFVARYLRHVLPRGMRSIRYYGYCHPAARAKRLRIQIHAGGPIHLGALPPLSVPKKSVPLCPCCNRPMQFVRPIPSPERQRGPPRPDKPEGPHRPT